MHGHQGEDVGGRPLAPEGRAHLAPQLLIGQRGEVGVGGGPDRIAIGEHRFERQAAAGLPPAAVAPRPPPDPDARRPPVALPQSWLALAEPLADRILDTRLVEQDRADRVRRAGWCPVDLRLVQLLERRVAESPDLAELVL